MSIALAAPKTRRLDARIDVESDDLIARAAALLGKSRSSFVVEAARDAADRQLARADMTIMPQQQFDAMMANIDEAEPLSRLQALFAAPRSYRRA